MYRHDIKSEAIWVIIIGCFALGAIIGAVISNPVINRKGYKFVLCWFALLNVIGALLLSLTTKVPQFTIGGLVVGVAAGAENNTMATYISDMATLRSRAILSSALKFDCSFGIMLDNACALGLAPPLAGEPCSLSRTSLA
ncbi:hypothetical protein DL89DRAFT_286160 [Linderina pennispora]|uniref:Major facilitator superfamily (MFS) profile domain-containing protein n=1 Tax=Linderina pennispora TaxID=61395 RepID=A0A1Y1VYR4_9FUNG|nr:uncharacterized protein DL89DRAFT_286160 [Linderina pennispora]ORX66410.1 hypothetical protein DL89DRAFT_286160 [Linderina pennispora]